MTILLTSDGAVAAGSIIAFGALILGTIAVYLLPTLIALERKHEQAAPIAIVNIFLGWTLVGWVVALAWSFSAQKNQLTRAEKIS